MEKLKYVSIVVFMLLVICILRFMLSLNTDKSQQHKVDIQDIDIDSSIVSTDPVETAYNFIYANGTMGNVKSDITQEKMKTNEAVFENSHRRIIALNKVKTAIIPGSPLIQGNEEENIDTFTRNLDIPYIYEINNIEVSEPSKLGQTVVYSEYGPTNYNAVEVLISFDSNRIVYTSAKDTSYDGTHIQVSNVERFENIKVNLVQSGDLWFVYDIDNAEELLNERFATWSGIHPSSIDYSKNVSTGEFKIEGIIKFE